MKIGWLEGAAIAGAVIGLLVKSWWPFFILIAVAVWIENTR